MSLSKSIVCVSSRCLDAESLKLHLRARQCHQNFYVTITSSKRISLEMEGFPKWLAFQTLNSQLDQKILFSKTWKCYFDEKIPFGPDKILPSKFQVRGIPQCHQQCKLKIETNGLANWQRSIWASLSDSASWYQHLRPSSDWWNGIKPLTFLFTAVPAFVWAAAGFSDSMITGLWNNQ